MRTRLARRTTPGTQETLSVSNTVCCLPSTRARGRGRRLVSCNQSVEGSLRVHCVPSCVLGSPRRPEEQMCPSNTFLFCRNAHGSVPTTPHSLHTHTHHTLQVKPCGTGLAVKSRSLREGFLEEKGLGFDLKEQIKVACTGRAGKDED